MGHVAFGLLFALPAWYLWNDRTSVAFVILAVVAALLPDIDTWFVGQFPDAIHHHGVTYTVLFVTLIGMAGAVLFAVFLTKRFDDWNSSERFDRRRSFVFAFIGLFVGGLSHIFADMLSAPDISTPIEPLWPFIEGSWGIDLVWYNSSWINVWFLLLMLIAHVVVAYLTTSVDHRHRLNLRHN